MTSLPELEQKQTAWDELMNTESQLSKKQKEILIHGFHHYNQNQITKKFDDLYF